MASGRLDAIPRFMDAASTSAQRAAALTHRLLAFARRQSLDIRPNDVNQLVASMEDLLHRTLGEHIELECSLSADLWTAFTDANQLESALLNLAINARDAMPDGGRLTIETTNVRLDAAYTSGQDDVAPGDYVVVGVSDTGSGMPADVVAMAVDPFFTTKPVGQGTGLGALDDLWSSEADLRSSSHLQRGRAWHDRQALPAPRPAGRGGFGKAREGIAPGTGRDDPCRGRRCHGAADPLDVLEELGYNVGWPWTPSAIPILQSDRQIDLMVSDVDLPHINGRIRGNRARRTSRSKKYFS